jgi:hypothetical protein
MSGLASISATSFPGSGSASRCSAAVRNRSTRGLVAWCSNRLRHPSLIGASSVKTGGDPRLPVRTTPFSGNLPLPRAGFAALAWRRQPSRPAAFAVKAEEFFPWIEGSCRHAKEGIVSSAGQFAG